MSDDNPRIGSLFSDWLKEQGIYDEVSEHAIKRVICWKIRTALGLTEATQELHAGYNLLGVLEDLKHYWPDEDCIETLGRVMGQLAEVEKIMKDWESEGGANEQRDL